MWYTGSSSIFSSGEYAEEVDGGFELPQLAY